MTKNWFSYKNIVWLILAVIVLLCIPQIIGIFLLFYSAYVVTASMEPLIAKLQKKMSRQMASIIAVAIFIIFSLVTIVPIIVVAVSQIIAFAQTLPDTFNSVYQTLSAQTFWGHKIGEFFKLQDFVTSMGGVGQNIVNKSIDFTVNIAHISAVLIIFTMITLYFAMDKEYLEQKFIEFFPDEMKLRAKNILDNITLRVGAYVRTQIISMIAVGVMVTIVLALLKVHYPILLGLISGVLDIIPIVGPAIALVAIIFVAYSAGWVKIILVICGFLLCQQLSNYVVRPFLFGKFMALHPLTLFLALFIAQKYLGLIGVILSPAIASTVCVLVDELYLKNINTPKQIETENNDGN